MGKEIQENGCFSKIILNVNKDFMGDLVHQNILVIDFNGEGKHVCYHLIDVNPLEEFALC